MTRTSTAHQSYLLYYHITWSVVKGLPLINDTNEIHLKNFILEKAKELGVRILAIESAFNHIHIIASMKPTHTIDQVVQNLKVSSSRFCNKDLSFDFHFKWNRGYDVRTVSERNLDRAVAYVKNQKKHHEE